MTRKRLLKTPRVAETCFNVLRGTFRLLVGVSYKSEHMNAAAFAKIVDGNPGNIDPWEVDEAWPVRDLPPSGGGASFWRPILRRTKDAAGRRTGIVRQAAPVDLRDVTVK